MSTDWLNSTSVKFSQDISCMHASDWLLHEVGMISYKPQQPTTLLLQNYPSLVPLGTTTTNQLRTRYYWTGQKKA